MSHEPDLIASYWTLAGNVLPHDPSMASPIDLKDRIEAAGRAGFRGMGLNVEDLAISRARHGDSEIRHMLRANGIRLVELEALLDWFADGERRAASDAQRSIAFEQARAVGAFQIKVIGDLAGDWPSEHMAEAFAQLCDEAAGQGLRITLELLPNSNMNSVARGQRLVELAGRPNGGLLFDAWHVARCGMTLDDISALPAGICAGVELDDGPGIPVIDDLYQEMIHARLLPGEGQFDLDGLLAATRAAGFSGPYGVEILSHAHRARSLDEAAHSAFATTRAVLDRAFRDNPLPATR